MKDSEIGMMFLNFMLEDRCVRMAAVYLTHYVEKGEGAPEGNRHVVRWGRCLMGDPPYQTGQGMGHTKEQVMGDPDDLSNVSQWKEVRINFTGTVGYDPSMAWVAKVREDGRLAA
jgi:hypothetical protein